MRHRPGWPWAMLVVLVSNLVAMGIWYWNLQGESLAVVELTEHQARVLHTDPDDSTLELRLEYLRGWPGETPPLWADSTRLLQLGFKPRQFSFENEGFLSPRRHPMRRPAWVLLALDANPEEFADTTRGGLYQRLLPVALGTDPEALYRESGNRSRYLVMRGVIALRTTGGLAEDSTRAWHADLDLITPERLHVPKSLGPVFEELAISRVFPREPRYLVSVALGRLHLPKVVGVLPAGND